MSGKSSLIRRGAVIDHDLRLDPVGLKIAPAGQARRSAGTKDTSCRTLRRCVKSL
jgi:hypothetical protein